MASKKREMPEAEELNVKAFGMIVDMLPRGERPANHPTLAGKPYTGVLQRDVATTFYAFLAKHKHPLAEVKKDERECSFDDPCGKCRRCVLQVTADSAEKAGLVVKIPRGKNVTVNGRIERRTWVTYYRPGEVTMSKNLDSVVDAVLAKL